MDWPRSPEELVVAQEALGQARPPPWSPGRDGLVVGGCFACFTRSTHSALGAGGDQDGGTGDQREEPGWAGAALTEGLRPRAVAAAESMVGACYQPGLLALREGRLLEAAVRRLPTAPHVLLVKATGRDHPRRAGLALHLGAVLGLPTVGVTQRPLWAEGAWPGEYRGQHSPLRLGTETVGFWVRTRTGARPLAVHAGWRTDPPTAVEVVLAVTKRRRTPEPLRLARAAAKRARSTAFGDDGDPPGRSAPGTPVAR